MNKLLKLIDFTEMFRGYNRYSYRLITQIEQLLNHHLTQGKAYYF